MHAVGAPFYFRNRGAPTQHVARLHQHVVPPHHPNYSQLGVRVHPPQPPLKESFLALCFPSQFDTYTTAFESEPQLSWIGVGLCVLAACAGRSTKSKGFQQTTRPSHPVRVARRVVAYIDNQEPEGVYRSGEHPCKWSTAFSAV